MANATNSTPGSIQLAGDLAGNNDATAPELTSTSVTPGSYTLASITVDGKGRITSSSSGSEADVLALVGNASSSQLGFSQFGTNITDETNGVFGVATASNTTLGLVKSADTNHITITNGAIDIGTGVVTTADSTHITVTNNQVDVGSDVALTDVENTFSAAIHTTKVTLTFVGSPSSISVDASDGNIFEVTLTGNSSLSNPTSLQPGTYTFIINQDGTGGRTLSFGTAYLFKSGASSTLSTTANAVDILSCVSDGTNMYCSLGGGFE